RGLTPNKLIAFLATQTRQCSKRRATEPMSTTLPFKIRVIRDGNLSGGAEMGTVFNANNIGLGRDSLPEPILVTVNIYADNAGVIVNIFVDILGRDPLAPLLINQAGGEFMVYNQVTRI